MTYRALFLTFLLLLSACSSQRSTQILSEPSMLMVSEDIRDCLSLYESVDNYVVAAGVVDAQAQRIDGFPYLRSNRFLSSFKEELQNDDAISFWLTRLYGLELSSRQVELQNLSLSMQALNKLGAESSTQLSGQLQECGRRLISADRGSKQRLQSLMQNVLIKDSYSDFARLAGIYPLTKLFVSKGVSRLQKEIMQTFELAETKQNISERVVSYGPETHSPLLSSGQIKTMLEQASNNLLGIPVLTKAEQDKLFSQFAPVWDVDVASDADRPGQPFWDDEGKLGINSEAPTVYQLLSYARVNDKVLIQLNYTLWFSERPPSSAFDILAGPIDGITWRVTIGERGKVLIYDSMHNCGCYHMFFPTERATFRAIQGQGEEPLLIPAIAPELATAERVHIRVASATHYIEAISVNENMHYEKRYKLSDYDELRRLSFRGKSKSMFGQRGIVAGTSRKERWLLWPMGVADPGAMRQWGNHATAFIGRRHFDDPYLIERYFKVMD